MPAHKGARHHYAKLTAKKVREIRKRYRWFTVTQKQLAEEYGISVRTVQTIIHRIYWRWVK